MVPFLLFLITQLLISILAIWKLIWKDENSRILIIMIATGGIGLLSKLILIAMGLEKDLLFTFSSTVCIAPLSSLYLKNGLAGGSPNWRSLSFASIPLLFSLLIFLYYLIAQPHGMHIGIPQAIASHFRDVVLYASLAYDSYLLYKYRHTLQHVIQYADTQLGISFIIHKVFLSTIFLLTFFNVTAPHFFLYTGLSSTTIILALVIYFKIIRSYSRGTIADPSSRETKPKTKYQKNSIDDVYLENKKAQIASLMTKENLFLDADLASAGLANRLDISNHELSIVFNYGMQTNFYQYINTLRIHYFLDHIDQIIGENKTILTLAYESGFQSKSTFNKYFKQELGISPSEYLKHQQGRLKAIKN